MLPGNGKEAEEKHRECRSGRYDPFMIHSCVEVSRRVTTVLAVIKYSRL